MPTSMTLASLSMVPLLRQNARSLDPRATTGVLKERPS